MASNNLSWLIKFLPLTNICPDSSWVSIIIYLHSIHVNLQTSLVQHSAEFDRKHCLSHFINLSPRMMLRLAGEGVLSIPFARTSVMQSCAFAFAVVDPVVWHGLPLEQRLFPKSHSDRFYKRLKTVLSDRAGVGSSS